MAATVWLGLTSLGIVHTAISLVALAAGALALIRHKEISWRTGLGRLYVWTTVLTCLTGFGIFQHGGFGRPHVLGIVTLLALAIGFQAGRGRLFGRFARHAELAAYSATFMFHWIPTFTETLTRLPLGAPLLASPDAPELKAITGVLLVLYAVGLSLQIRRLRGGTAPLSPPDRSAQALDLRALALAFEPALLRTVGGLGGAPRARHRRHAVDDCLQARDGIGAVHLLAAVLLGLEHQHALLRDAAVAQREQPFLQVLWQRARADVVAQMDRARDLVDVLPARALGTDRAEIDLGFVDEDGGRCCTGCIVRGAAKREARQSGVVRGMSRRADHPARRAAHTRSPLLDHSLLLSGQAED